MSNGLKSNFEIADEAAGRATRCPNCGTETAWKDTGFICFSTKCQGSVTVAVAPEVTAAAIRDLRRQESGGQ